MRALLTFIIGLNAGVFLTLSTEELRKPTAPATPLVPAVVVGPITKTSPVSMPIRAAAKEMLKRNEAISSYVYRDSEGNPTIGVGFNLSRPDADKKLRRIKTTKARVLAGETLTDVQIDTLLDVELTDVLQDLVTLLPDFADMPPKAQLVLIDLRFNCGPGGLRTFVNTLQSIKTAQWQDAAQRLAASQWAVQVGDRAARAVTLLRGIS
jgi:GH24 family phage-related lysozyme (muramidase)